MKYVIGIIALIVNVSLCFGGPASQMERNAKVKVVFEFPKSEKMETELDYNSACSVLRENPLPKGVRPTPHKVDLWVYAALQKLQLHFETNITRNNKSSGKTIVAIRDVRNGPNGKWAYMVNGIKSKYHIDTQLEETKGMEIRYIYGK